MNSIVKRLLPPALSALLGLIGTTSQAAVVVLDFGTGGLLQPPTFSAPYTEDGFRFTTINQPFPDVVDQDHFDIFNSIAGNELGPDGEREMAIHTGHDGDEVIVDASGAAFDLLSLDLEQIQNPTSGGWEIIGSNGAQLTFTGVGIVSFDSAWLNITSFTMRATSLPSDTDFSGYLVADDLTVNDVPTTVPLPAGLPLLASGMAIALRRARRRH